MIIPVQSSVVEEQRKRERDQTLKDRGRVGPAQRQHHHARKEQSWPPPGLSAVGPDLEAVIVWIFRLDFSRGVFLGVLEF